MRVATDAEEAAKRIGKAIESAREEVKEKNVRTFHEESLPAICELLRRIESVKKIGSDSDRRQPSLEQLNNYYLNVLSQAQGSGRVMTGSELIGTAPEQLRILLWNRENLSDEATQDVIVAWAH